MPQPYQPEDYSYIFIHSSHLISPTPDSSTFSHNFTSLLTIQMSQLHFTLPCALSTTFSARTGFKNRFLIPPTA